MDKPLLYLSTQDVIDLGGLKEPSLEVILASDLDFLILMPTLIEKWVASG